MVGLSRQHGRRGMATRHDPSLLYVLVFYNLIVCFSVGETKIIPIPAKPGQNVTLPCKAAENKPVIVLEWNRTDLGEDEYVYVYRDETFYYQHQHPAYRGRVDLQDREIKDGNVSLVLKNVMINDTGKYECRVAHGEHKRRKRSHLDSDPICIINLNVSSPGNKGKKEEKPKRDEENNIVQTVVLYVGVPVGVVVLVLHGVVVFLLYKRGRQIAETKRTSRSLKRASTY